MDRILNYTVKLRRSRMTKIVRNTLTILFPIMLIGSFAEVLKFTFLTKNGYMARMFGIPYWLPFNNELNWIMGVIFHCTIDMIALYAAYGAAYFTAKEYKKDAARAGAVGLMAFLIISFQPNSAGMPDFSRFLMSEGMLIALVVGYLCSRILVIFGNSQLDRRSQVILPVIIIIILSSLLNFLGIVMIKLEIPTYVASFVMQHTQINALFYVLGMGTLTDLLSWMAVGGPFTNSPTFTDTPSMANLSAALKAGSPWKVPYNFTDTTLFHSFANFGGTGVTLALIIAILIFSKKPRNRNVSKWAIFPAIFNNDYPMMLGIPVLFNPIYLIPFVVAPLINMIIAALFITLRLIPAAVYPVPVGTPGPLIGFIGTNGNWLTLVLGIFLIILDVLIYMPFVRLSDQISTRAGQINEED